MTKRKANSDPTVTAIMRDFATYAEQMEARLNQHYAVIGTDPIRVVRKPQIRKKDKNPWAGKSNVPVVLVRMMLSGIGLEKATADQRNALMLPEAIRAASNGTKSIETATVKPNWSNAQPDYVVQPCHKMLTDAGYKPSKQDISLSAMRKLIQAGKPQEGPNDSLAVTWGHGIHAVAFFSQSDMLYRGERVRVQWRNTKKGAGLTGATAEVHRGRERLGGLWKFLKESVGRDHYDEIRDLARRAEGKLVGGQLLAAKQAKEKAEQKALSVSVDAMFETTAIPGGMVADEYNHYPAYDDGGEGGE